MSRRRRKCNAPRGSKPRVKKPTTGSSAGEDWELTPAEQLELVRLRRPIERDPEWWRLVGHKRPYVILSQVPDRRSGHGES